MNIIKKIIVWWNSPRNIDDNHKKCILGGGILSRRDWFFGKVVDTNGFGDYAHSYCAKAYNE